MRRGRWQQRSHLKMHQTAEQRMLLGWSSSTVSISANALCRLYTAAVGLRGSGAEQETHLRKHRYECLVGQQGVRVGQQPSEVVQQGRYVVDGFTQLRHQSIDVPGYSCTVPMASARSDWKSDCQP
jgi:hypothetical protein